MDKFVKGENEMWKMPATERIQTRIGAEKRGLFRHRHSLEDVQVKRNTQAMQQSSLITEMWQNISGENLRLLNSKMLSIFGST